MGPGRLIVNADDLGHDARATDLILECFAAGLITSASGMLFMEDSDRAARRAREAGLPVGLHINLSEAFTDPATPNGVRERQARLARRFGPDQGRRALRWLYDPSIRADVQRCIADQLERYHELYSGPPTHADGHQHVHLSPNVLVAPVLAPGTRMRGALLPPPGRRSLAAGLTVLKQQTLGRRFTRPDHFFDIAEVDPRGGPDPVARLDLAYHSVVEVMCHPGFDHEYERLTAPEWAQALRGRPLGSFADRRESTSS